LTILHPLVSQQPVITSPKDNTDYKIQQKAELSLG